MCKPAISALETIQYIGPPLHVELGLLNHALKKGFIVQVDCRLEILSKQLLLTSVYVPSGLV